MAGTDGSRRLREGWPARVGTAAALSVAFAGIVLAGLQGARAKARSADTILAEFAAVPYPHSVESDRPEDHQAFLDEMDRCTRLANALALELFERHPEHPEVTRLMHSRWWLARRNLGEPESVFAETQQLLSPPARVAAELHRAALRERAFAAIGLDEIPFEQVERYVEQALDEAPDPRKSPHLLWELATRRARTAEEQRRVLVRLMREHRETGFAKDAALHHRLLDRIGQPLELAFEDAVSGERVDLADFRGGPTVILVQRMSPVFPETRERVGRLARWQSEVGGAALLCVWKAYDPADATAIGELTRSAGIEWNVHLDCEPFRHGWIGRLRPAITPLYLLVDAQGRLARASMRFETLFETAG